MFSSKLDSWFIASLSYSSKPSKFKEMAEIDGVCAHVCMGMSVVVIYNFRHVSLEI